VVLVNHLFVSAPECQDIVLEAVMCTWCACASNGSRELHRSYYT